MSKPLSVLALALLLVAMAQPARSVPSFARQTGMSCAACHTGFPELTPFGRQFKLGGYVLGAKDKISDVTPPADGAEAKDSDTHLEIDNGVPLSAMIQAEMHWVRNDAATDSTSTVTAGSDGQGYASLPTQVSLFYAGEIAPMVGAFMQLTYDPNNGSVGIDNTDLRAVDHFSLGSHDLLLGGTINNNMTAQDVYNTTPAWGFPFASPDSAPDPAVAVQLEGALAQNVAGLGAYVDWDGWLYAEITAYRTNPQTGYTGLYIQGWAPYWRLAAEWDHGKHSLELGTYGVSLSMLPGNINLGLPVDHMPMDMYTDVAVDSQYQYIGDNHIFTVLANYIHESQELNYSLATGGVADNHYNDLQDLHLTGSYLYKRALGASVGYFQITGSNDFTLYNTTTGLAGQSPDSNGMIYELSYRPWLNTRLSLDYTAYGKFDGETVNIDGKGRGSADNNTTTLMAWVAY